MEYANDHRATKTNNKSNTKKQKVSARDIKILPIDHKRTFTQEIPEQLKYKNYLGKLLFWNKASRDRWSWDKIPKDAQRLDNEIDRTTEALPFALGPKGKQAAETLKKDSIAYIDKNESYIGEEREYVGEDETKIIISKRSLVARNMVNKVVSELEDGGSFRGKGIEEGAKDSKDDVKSYLKYLDCRHKKLFEHEPTVDDCRQIGLENSDLQDTLRDILNNNGSKPIKDMFKDEGDSGYVQVRLYYPKNREKNELFWSWKPKYYRVPKKIPVAKSKDKQIYKEGNYWVHYFKAAIEKSHIINKLPVENLPREEQNKLCKAMILGIDETKRAEALVRWAEQNIQISPNIDKSKKFYDIIPELFKDEININTLIKDEAQRLHFSEIKAYAKKLDLLLDSGTAEAKKLKKQCFALIDLLENINNSDYLLVRTVGSKLNLIARKMINKVVSELEDSGSFSGVDKQGNKIKEDAKDVTLNLGTELYRKTNPNAPNAEIAENSLLKYKDCRHKKLFEQDPTARDCRQESLGDCWLQSALISILTQKGPQPIKDMFKDEGDSGYVQVRLYYPENRVEDKLKWRWEPRYYRVPKKIPVYKKNGKPIYNLGAYWVHYLQAAVAKSDIRNLYKNENRTKTDQNNNKTRDYSSVVSGKLELAWLMILGGPIPGNDILLRKPVLDIILGNKVQNFKKLGYDLKVDEVFYYVIRTWLMDNRLISISFNPDTLKHRDSDVGKSGGEHMDRGLVTKHAYAVVGVEEIDGVKYIKLINPWSNRKGRKYIDYDKGKKGAHGIKKMASFAGQDDESSLLKATTALRHLLYLSIY